MVRSVEPTTITSTWSATSSAASAESRSSSPSANGTQSQSLSPRASQDQHPGSQGFHHHSIGGQG